MAAKARSSISKSDATATVTKNSMKKFHNQPVPMATTTASNNSSGSSIGDSATTATAILKINEKRSNDHLAAGNDKCCVLLPL